MRAKLAIPMMLALATAGLLAQAPGSKPTDLKAAARTSLAQLDGTIGFRGCTVGEIRMILVFILQVLQCLAGFIENILLPGQKLVAKIVALLLIHERLSFRRPVILQFGRNLLITPELRE